jgi:hypothetical protein
VQRRLAERRGEAALEIGAARSAFRDRVDVDDGIEVVSCEPSDFRVPYRDDVNVCLRLHVAA